MNRHRQLLNALSRTPFVDSTELAVILGEPHATVYRVVNDVLANGIIGHICHGAAHLPSSHCNYLTGMGISAASEALDFDAVISLHNRRSFCVVRQGPALRRRPLYDRLWAIAA